MISNKVLERLINRQRERERKRDTEWESQRETERKTGICPEKCNLQINKTTNTNSCIKCLEEVKKVFLKMQKCATLNEQPAYLIRDSINSPKYVVKSNE